MTKGQRWLKDKVRGGRSRAEELGVAHELHENLHMGITAVGKQLGLGK